MRKIRSNLLLGRHLYGGKIDLETREFVASAIYCKKFSSFLDKKHFLIDN